jgi:hypothetical protein
MGRVLFDKVHQSTHLYSICVFADVSRRLKTVDNRSNYHRPPLKEKQLENFNQIILKK